MPDTGSDLVKTVVELMSKTDLVRHILTPWATNPEVVTEAATPPINSQSAWTRLLTMKEAPGNMSKRPF